MIVTQQCFFVTFHLKEETVSSFDIYLQWKVFAESNSAPIINDNTLMKMIGGLNETIGVVLDYLQDAKARL